MTKNEATPNGASSNSPSPPQQGGEQPAAGSRKAAFEELASEKQRREALLVKGTRIAAGVAGAVVIIGGIVFLLPSGGDEGVPLEERIAEAPKSLTCDETTMGDADIAAVCAKRAEFQESYRVLTTEILPGLEAAAGEAFVREALAEIQEIETRAVLAFDRSDFDVAVIAVQQALEATKQLENEIAETFASSFSEAQSAFLRNDADTAAEWIGQATRLAPQNAEAAALSQRVSVLPEVLVLKQKAADAAVQNQLLKQHDFLEKIVALDPARQDVAHELVSIREQINQARYNDLLRKATLLIEGQSLGEARASLRQAAAIYPGRDDVTKLTRQINELEKKQRIAAMLAQARDLESQDRWPDAASLYQQILADEPANLRAINGLDKATRTVSANNRAVDILNNQHRMQDARIHQRIGEFVDEIRPLARDSATLSKTVETLEQTLAQWLQDKKVTVLSDGKSLVKVRRVGIVGVTSSKDIKLRPGNYEFECTRQGYRSKIVQHFVPPDKSASSISITCDVPI